MRWCWFGLAEDVSEDAFASAAARDLQGEPAGYLAAWDPDAGHPKGTARISGAVIDPSGPEMAVSLVLPPSGVQVLFDDPAVVAATQAVYERPGVSFVTTLTTDPVHFGGAVTGTTAPWRGWWSDDPFERIFPARRLLVEPGLFNAVAPPAGPVHQRYAGLPWPAEGFE